MDALSIYYAVKVFIFVFAMLLACASLVITWRFRGIFHWKRSLRQEINQLRQSKEHADAPRRKAANIVLEQCQTAWDATYPELKSLDDIFHYLRAIASCFYPHKEMPELQISFKQLLRTARELAGRLEQIMSRPGIKHLRHVRIRHIRQSYAQYERFRRSRLIIFFNRYIKRLYRLHWVILGDPLSLIVYFSNRLTVLTVTRCLLVDMYLYFGTLAIEAYAHPTDPDTELNTEESLENIFKDLDAISVSRPFIEDPRILEIRNRLVGTPAILVNPPGLDALRDSIKKTAVLTAETYFPDAEKPLEEIALGPLLERGHMWIRALCETEKLSGIKRFHEIKLASFYTVKSFTDRLLPPQVRAAARSSWRLYRWARYPFKLYRLIRKTSPLAISLQAGWFIAQRGALQYIYRYAFDMAYREVQIMCKESNMLSGSEKSRKQGKPVEEP